MSKTESLIQRIEATGFSGGFVRACLPDWWDEQAEDSESAWLQMRLGMAERLSLDPITLLDDSKPLQLSDVGRAKFKHLNLQQLPRHALEGFALGLSRLLLAATTPSALEIPSDATEIRNKLLPSNGGAVGLGELLAFCFAAGIPVAHLTQTPVGKKGVAAMVTALGTRAAIFTAREPLHPAQLAFFVAHELGHFALGHVRNGRAIIEGTPLGPRDMADVETKDDEERAADAFALELLTGTPSLTVDAPANRGTARELRDIALATAGELRVDPGLLILCFGRETGRWAQATKALGLLPGQQSGVGAAINKALRGQLDTERFTPADWMYLDLVAAA